MRVRVSVRWLMVLVALSALGVGPVYRYLQTLRRRSQEYAEIAKEMKGSVALYGRMATLTFQGPERTEAEKRLAAWHAERAVVYEQGSRRPWIVIPWEAPPPLPPPRVVKLEPMPKFEFSPPPKPTAEMTEAEKRQEALRLVEELKGHLGQLKRGMSRGKRAMEAAREAVTP